jgi:hypothetical protein
MNKRVDTQQPFHRVDYTVGGPVRSDEAAPRKHWGRDPEYRSELEVIMLAATDLDDDGQ